jgi:tubulin polyglutamylase TTLL6/13
MIFEILGFDIMFDDTGKPYLLEVNHSPSFMAGAPIDLRIKRALIDDTLTLLDLNVPRKQAYIKRHNEEFQKRMFTGKQSKYTPEEKQRLAREYLGEREDYESDNMGNFKLIYPVGEPDPYGKFLKASFKTWEEFNFGPKPVIEKRRRKKQQHKRAISYSNGQKKAIAQLQKGVDPSKINQGALRDLQRKKMFGCLKKKDENKLGVLLEKVELQSKEAE